MNRAITTLLLFCASFVLAPLPASAVTINWTPVANPGNAGEVQSQGTFGAVSYDYLIGTYEVTNSQYAEFLNAKDATGANTLALYNSGMTSDIVQGGINFSTGNANGSKYAAKAGRETRPVNYVSWYDAIRFANWLNNGQGIGDTESGAYTLLGGMPTPSNGLSITRNSGATVFLASEDEWYKAAYYDSASTSYFDYPTASNTAPTAEAPPGGSNSANYNEVVSQPTDVGAYTSSDSPYGTFDQGGNVLEWNEALISDTLRGARGSSFGGNLNALLASNRFKLDPTFENSNWGFRVASVPEPSSLLLAALGLVGALLGWRRRKRR